MSPGAPAALARAAIDALLGLDEGLVDELAPLHGAILAVRVEGVGVELWLRPGPDGIEVIDPRTGEADALAADVTVAGPPFSLLALLARAGDEATLPPESVTIAGDVSIVQRLRAIAARADLDLEEPIARIVGDAPAHAAGRLLRALTAWGREAGATALDDVGEYVRHESAMVPDARAVRAFADAVDDARDDADRLEARIARLEREGRER